MQRSNIKKITTLFVAVILCSVASFSQITQPAAVIDYVVRKEAVTDPALIPSLSNAEKTKAIAYVDGFGRPLQNIVVAASPGGKDIVSFNKYDEFGRQPIQYLPFEAATNTGAYNDMSTIVAAQLNFYSPSTAAAKKIAGDNYPYSENSFETSPLGRVLKVGGVGDGFQLNQHYKTMSYRNGTAAENVRIWVLNASNATSIDFYADNEFTVSEVMDENNVRAAVYKDKFGRLILKRQDSPLFGFYDTYYVYDNIGNIVYIVPPKAIVKMMGDYNTALTPDLIYQFWYDSKNRIIRKKVPGAAEVYMVYDPLDRVVLTQDGNMRFNGGTKWAYVKYDNANRVIIQGIYTHGSVLSQSAMQSFVDGQPCYLPASTTYYEVKQAGSSGYSNQCFPTGGTEERGYNYFDNYDFNFDGIADYSKLSQGLPNEAPATDLTYGLATGSKKKILGSGTPGTWITEVSFYDKYYHTIQVRSSNQLNSTVADHTTNVVGFTGKAIEARQYKDFTSFNITVGTRYEYDDMERLTKVKQTNPGSAEITVAKYEYNALGQLVDKKLHSADGINYLQSVDMRYNIRGQLLSINNSARNINPDNNDETNDLFGMEIFYDKVESTGLGNTPNYTGMISAIKWSAQSPANTDERSYKYSYDKLYRLTFSQYQAKQSGAWTKHPDGFNESTSYDENGNITSLQRSAVLNNVITQIDALNYSYKNTGNSNQLENISDGITTNAPGYGYRNFTGSTNPYTYDDNGNLNADPKKNTTTTYNELNKPTLIVMPGINTNQVIEYRYDAAGVRISKYVTSGTSTSTLKQIEYVGGYTIEDGRLSYYGMAEGRVRNDGSGSTLNLKMEYFITDQQGNTRVSFEDNGTGTNTAKLTQENSYYAFGMQMEGSYTPAVNPNKKLYNAGSEWQDDVEGIADYYSTFFREYDPIIGRFNGVDPMSESFESWTTYHYSYNNPVNFNDPMGDNPVDDAVREMQAEMRANFNSWRDSRYGNNLPDRGWDFGSGGEFMGGGGGGTYQDFKERLDYLGSPEWQNDNGIGGAWEIKNQWSSKYIEMFGKEFSSIIVALSNAGQKFTCDDLALHAVIAFSSKNNLPFIWETGSGTFDASDTKYKNVSEFLLDVKQHSGAADFARNANTSKVDLQNIKTGTLNVLTSNGRAAPNHIQIISSVFNDDKVIPMKGWQGVTGFMAVQGNFNVLGRVVGSDDPSNWRYLGVPIQTGLYNVKNNSWINITNREVTLNFIGGHYSNQYRNFNFLNWNRK